MVVGSVGKVLVHSHQGADRGVNGEQSVIDTLFVAAGDLASERKGQAR